MSDIAGFLKKDLFFRPRDLPNLTVVYTWYTALRAVKDLCHDQPTANSFTIMGIGNKYRVRLRIKQMIYRLQFCFQIYLSTSRVVIWIRKSVIEQPWEHG